MVISLAAVVGDSIGFQLGRKLGRGWLALSLTAVDTFRHNRARRKRKGQKSERQWHST